MARRSCCHFPRRDPIVRFPSPPSVLRGRRRAGCLPRPSLLSARRAAEFGLVGVGSAELRNSLGGSGRFALALLPTGSGGSGRAVHARRADSVDNTRVDWSVDEARARVRVRFSYSLAGKQGTRASTLFALYPHQSAALVDAAARPELGSYTTVRGRMSLREAIPSNWSIRFPACCPRSHSFQVPTSKRCAPWCGAMRPPTLTA